jgi:hypothetical protein
MDYCEESEGSSESAFDNIRVEAFLEEFIGITDFNIVNGGRRYKTKWLRGDGKQL